jgi:siderophore synthetase component
MIEERAATERRIAVRATMQSLLNCFLRETGKGELLEPGRLERREGPGGAIRCLLERQGIEILAPLRYASPTSRHLFEFPIYYRPSGASEPLELDHATLGALLIKELDPGAEGRGDELLLRVIDSCSNVERFARARQDDADRLYAFRSDFITTEQALVFGHHLHPTPKSRQGMDEGEMETYSPELQASFPLHYFRAHGSLVREGSALRKTATALIKGELHGDPAVSEEFKAAYCGEDGYSLVPAHPWQAEFLLRRPEVRRLIGKGSLEHLGPVGSPYSPTSSVRTVYRGEAEFMLKFSLGVKITNSVRNNLLKELRRGIKMHRILEGEIGEELRERFPRFGIIRDPAYVTLDTGTGKESGFEVILRENPFRGEEQPDATPVIALCQDRLSGEGSRLARVIRDLAEREGRPTSEVSLDWFRRYLNVSLRPILWLYFTHGIAPEAHQQNSVLVLNDGYPHRFYYRDNQGYYFAASAREALERRLPGINEIEGDTVVADAVVDERLRYYFFINNLFGLVNAFGAARLVDEQDLLSELRSTLAEIAPSSPEASDLIPSLLHLRRLPGKANLLTRLHDMDELVGDLETQSVYVEIENPLAKGVRP